MNLIKKFSAQFIIVSIFILFIFYTLITNFVFQVTKIKEYNQEIEHLSATIKDVKDGIKEIKKEDEVKVKDDLESTARKRLNMVKPGEIIYIDIAEGDN